MVEVKENLLKIKLNREINESYEILFGESLFPTIVKELKEKPLGNRYAIITDTNVGPLYAYLLKECLEKEGLTIEIFSFEAGEQHKSIDSCMKVIGEMSKLKYGRDSAILSLGGGVVGDMAGFIAAIFNRGVPYIQIPTTVLAQADSSVGGKTAVDTAYGKNLIGAFKQPEKVYIDVEVLKTLPDEIFIEGLAETVKHGIITDKEFFDFLLENKDKILGRVPQTMLTISKKNCEIKGTVVEIDPYEKNIRSILNYGHTVGHAIEKLSNFEISHGEAISIGMMVAARISNSLGGLSVEEIKVQKNLLKEFGLPTKVPKSISGKELLEVTSIDKKAQDGRAKYVLPITIGQMNNFGGSYSTYVDNELVLEAIENSR